MIITALLSSFQALKSQKLNNLIVSNILHMYVTNTCIDTRALFFAGYKAIIGLHGNDQADVLARLPCVRQNQFYNVPYEFR